MKKWKIYIIQTYIIYLNKTKLKYDFLGILLKWIYLYIENRWCVSYGWINTKERYLNNYNQQTIAKPKKLIIKYNNKNTWHLPDFNTHILSRVMSVNNRYVINGKNYFGWRTYTYIYMYWTSKDLFLVSKCLLNEGWHVCPILVIYPPHFQVAKIDFCL